MAHCVSGMTAEVFKEERKTLTEEHRRSETQGESSVYIGLMLCLFRFFVQIHSIQGIVRVLQDVWFAYVLGLRTIQGYLLCVHVSIIV